MTATTYHPGDMHGRWTVVRRATPELRDGCMRPRVFCRCVCGWEQIVWVGDIQRGRSLGCRHASCRHRHEAAAALRRVFPAPMVDSIMELAAHREQPVHRILDEALAELRGGRVEA